MIAAVVGTGLGAHHAAAAFAEEGVFKEQWRNANLNRIEFIKDVVRVVGAVIAADSGCITSDNEMGAAVILARNGMKKCFSRPSVAHCCREYTEHYPASWIPVRQDRLVAGDADIGRHIIIFRLPH